MGAPPPWSRVFATRPPPTQACEGPGLKLFAATDNEAERDQTYPLARSRSELAASHTSPKAIMGRGKILNEGQQAAIRPVMKKVCPASVPVMKASGSIFHVRHRSRRSRAT